MTGNKGKKRSDGVRNSKGGEHPVEGESPDIPGVDAEVSDDVSQTKDRRSSRAHKATKRLIEEAASSKQLRPQNHLYFDTVSGADKHL